MYTDLLILAALWRRSRHGYSIKQYLARAFPPLPPLTNSVLYPALRRFEEFGAVEHELQAQDGRPSRHVYHLTDLGETLLVDLLREFPPEAARSEIEFVVRVTYFSLIEPLDRLRILRARREVLLARQANLPHLRESSQDSGLLPFVEDVLALSEQSLQLHMSWIEALITRESQQAEE